MTTPFYVSPEQLMKDRADYVRKNIARGGSVAVLNYDGGILFVAENRSRVLHKISEIYDRVGFAAAGKYNEFENLRQAGVRLADTRGYLYDRRDVSALGLANAYAQTLGTIFSEAGGKPYEVELIIAEVGDRPEQDQIYRLTYDGSVADAHGFVVIGGAADEVSRVLESSYTEGAHLGAALRTAVAALGRDGTETRELSPTQLEVAVLDRSRKRDRKFRRLVGAQLARLLADEPGADEAAVSDNGNGENGNGETGGGAAGGAAAGDGGAAPASGSAKGGASAEQGDILDDIDDVLEDGDDADGARD
jgi:proteasome alpha subunit